jgi:hypothetical protein
MWQVLSRRFIVIGLGVLSLLWLSGQALQTQALSVPTIPDALAVTVLSPQGGAADVVGEGDDYFTQVQHNPRDMNDKDDLIWQVFGIDNISYANGIWSGTTSNTPAGSYSSIYAIYPGDTAHPSGDVNDQSANEIGVTGWNYPVDANKYKQLSFRLKAPATASTTPNNWWHAGYTNISFTFESGHYEGHYPADAQDWQVYTADMPWSPPIYGLEFRFGLATGTYQFDWMRLTDPTTSPVYTITFSVDGAQVGDVVDLDCYMAASGTADNYCGSIAKGIATDASTTYSYYWHTTYLPPGQYFVKATARHAGTAVSTDMSSGALTIQGAPLLALDNPSMTSGPDFATEVMGNPWDMNDSSDIFTSSDLFRFPHDFQAPCPCFANGEMYGTVGRFDSHDPTDTGDPFVYLRVGYQNAKSIDTSKYKYLTYRLKVDRTPWWPNSGDRLSESGGVYPAGWLTRLIFFHSWFLDLAHSNTSNDIVIFDDWNTYQMDLSQGVPRGYWEPQIVQPGGYWTGFKTAFRFDMVEGVDPWVFHLDDVKLTGDDTADASYQVNWTVLSDNQPTKIDFYASTNRSACLTSGESIGTWTAGGNPPPPPPGGYRIYVPLIVGGKVGGDTSFVWPTAGETPGTYAICARVSDGFNTSTAVSDAYVVISH